MKRIIFGLMLAMMFCTLVQGANRTVTENDGQGNKKRSHRIEGHCHQWRNRNRHTQCHDL